MKKKTTRKKASRKKATRKKTTRKTPAKKSVKRRRSTTKKSPLMRKIDELNALANKSLRNAEAMALKSKTAKTASLRRSYSKAVTALTKIASRAQAKANELIAKQTK